MSRSPNSSDFIVVCAGASGSVIAARLSEDQNARGLVIEAGSPTPLHTGAVPPERPSLIHGGPDWGGSTILPSRNRNGCAPAVRTGHRRIVGDPDFLPTTATALSEPMVSRGCGDIATRQSPGIVRPLRRTGGPQDDPADPTGDRSASRSDRLRRCARPGVRTRRIRRRGPLRPLRRFAMTASTRTIGSARSRICRGRTEC